ncbi:hypothetical protein GCM10010330_79180 [Streptomyces tendae]|uniref:hypothetical protein n=1 Tax=Streptomyces tendae TaxID=1932 RepID=UPI0016774EFF|nr:hypothetical protein [Streptomyces tendae]GHB13426.1 hypothetical protein GCM10010330_79180 [Streptomyces tendae]
MRGTSEEPSCETARAVRRLLEETVPSPAAPADRMERIAMRVRRRRRRCTAAGAVVSVAAVAVAVTVGPGQLHGSTPAEPAAPPSGTAVAQLLDPSRPVWAQVPQGWHSLTVKDADGGFVGFLASQPLHPPVPEGCYRIPAAALHGCLPLDGLEAGSAFLVFRYGAGRHDGRGAKPLGQSVVPPLKTCAGTQADRESIGWETVHPAGGGTFDVQVSVCLKEPSEATAALAEKVLDDMFPHTGQ